MESARLGGVFGLLEHAARMSALPPVKIGEWWLEVKGPPTATDSGDVISNTYTWKTSDVYADNNWSAMSNIISWEVKIQQQTKERVSDAGLDNLRSNLEKVLEDETCKKFINSIISQIKDRTLETFAGPKTFKKFEGNILENFDRIRSAGGYWLDDFSSLGQYVSQTITFQRNHYNKDGEKFDTYQITENNNMIPVNPRVQPNFKISQRLRLTLTLVHELIHAYHLPNNGSIEGTRHIDMNRMALNALKELGIKPTRDDLINEADTYREASLQACKNVKL